MMMNVVVSNDVKTVMTKKMDEDSFLNTNKLPGTLAELLSNYKDDGKRDAELYWGNAQGSELQW